MCEAWHALETAGGEAQPRRIRLGAEFHRAATIKYLHTDALGSPVAVTNDPPATLTVLERSVYEPYGKLLSGPVKNGPGYTGHALDVATGLNYMQQRYYDPDIGRFLSVDPVTADSSTGANFNRYKYAANNPYTFIDPDGREEEAWAQIGDAFRFEFAKRSYRNETNLAVKAKIAERLSFEYRVKYGDRSSAQRYQLEADTLKGASAGVIYRRIDPKTGDIYIGRADSPEHFQARQNDHDAKLGVAHDYEVVARAKPGLSLQVAEETQIRLHGGLRKEGGELVNKRHEMRQSRYGGAGGREPPATGTRIRRTR
jgi:RHS repeat-associated protein